MREAQIGSNLIDRLARLGLRYLDFNIFRQYVGSADAIVPRNLDARETFRLAGDSGTEYITDYRVRAALVFRVAQSARAQSLRNVF